MFTLFIDTTFGITVGVLDSNNSWLNYNFTDSKKSSSIVHRLIKDALTDANIDENSLKRFVQVSGPGSYTGMRVSDGISQVFEWQNINCFAFHHFQVPKVLGIESGVWLAKAFKGEVFCYVWNDNEEKKILIKEAELDEFLREKNQIFVGHKQEFISNVKATSDLIKNDSVNLFDYIFKQNLKEPLYYYRSLEDEFSKGK